MIIVSVVRGKNGLKYWPKLLPQLAKIGDITVILDDYSTDGSYEWLCERAKEIKNVLIIRQPDPNYDGGRDWNVIYEFVAQFKPDWIWMCDVDEFVEGGCEINVRQLAEKSGLDIAGWSFPFYYLWNDVQHYRDDGEYSNTRVIRLFRYYSNIRPPKRVSHSTCLPDELDRRIIRVAPVRMWHYGYMLPEDRKAKYQFYTARDKDPKAAGAGSANYDNMLQEPDMALLPVVRDLASWSNPSSTRKLGDFLNHAPVRAVVGSFFPTAEQMSGEELLKYPDNNFDEIRISYVFDGMDLKEAKSILIAVNRVLRPGGRLEVTTIDYQALCKRFAASDASKEERFEMKTMFEKTPLLQPIKTMYTYELLTTAMQDSGYDDWQQITLKEFPYRLYCICFKKGEPRWH